MSDLNYTTYVTRLANMFPISSEDANFQTFIPDNINYAEQRNYRELDLIAVQVTDATTQTSSGNRDFILPTGLGTFITVDQINLITPALRLVEVPTAQVQADEATGSSPV